MVPVFLADAFLLGHIFYSTGQSSAYKALLKLSLHAASSQIDPIPSGHTIDEIAKFRKSRKSMADRGKCLQTEKPVQSLVLVAQVSTA